MRIMVDTNILVSGMLFDGTERLLLNYAHKNKFKLLVSEFSLIEIRSVLEYKFPGKEYILDQTMRLLPVEVVPVSSQEKIKSAGRIIRDPKDKLYQKRFQKKTDKIPKKEINIALRRLKRFLER